ncbi:hypothetical protein [Rhodopirellula sp. SWK7]|uniref:hypothetical protein n=1 Tax=Rhodopirellula sp. SWK7 TaxID=595460 RepID=UPI0002BFB305|nr:hypothetical protein [Rhodopirellula sp. SWK7]EMI40540.1 hypothetical protein RRSWK_06949 [Rhodopirellula sp. SWK7]
MAEDPLSDEIQRFAETLEQTSDSVNRNANAIEALLSDSRRMDGDEWTKLTASLCKLRKQSQGIQRVLLETSAAAQHVVDTRRVFP